MRLFLILCLSLHLFANPFETITPSTSEEIFSLTNGLLIDGFVSASSGQICLSETDLHIKAAQDLYLKRTYIPPQILGRYEDCDELDQWNLRRALLQLKTKGWVVHPHLWAGYNTNSPYFQVRDPQGFVLEFEIQRNKGILKTSPYGCSNLRGDEPTSAADIRNILFSKEGDQIKIIWPDGIQRHYSKNLMGLYRLDKEILLNGKVIRYEYKNFSLIKISSCDPTQQFTYATITKEKGKRYVASDGREVNLFYEVKEIKGKFTKGTYKEKINLQFPVMTKASTPSYTNIATYNERTLLCAYDTKAYPISCTYFQEKNTLSRIKTFSTPSGSTSFTYDPPIAGQRGGSTTVAYSNGAKVVYRFNKLLLLTAIENWLDDQLINQKTFTYDYKQHIQSIKMLDGQGKLLLAKRYECDPTGNPIIEEQIGDFGTFCIKRIFNNNRLIFEERDDGLITTYTYLGSTYLLTSKTLFELGKELRKTTYIYDEANNLIEEIEEGKTRTTYILYSQAPHLHRVEWEEKRDWNQKLIKKVHYLYDSWGHIAQEEHFDSDSQLAYIVL